MTANMRDSAGVQALARDLGVPYTLDPTITPKRDGDTSILNLRIPGKFIDIWRHSSELNDVRSIRAKDLTVCSRCSHVGTCTRCPGLAYMEGSMRGPSAADCEKSFHRTGVRSANMLRKDSKQGPVVPLIQIRAAFA
jgi:hypothetical protein